MRDFALLQFGFSHDAGPRSGKRGGRSATIFTCNRAISERYPLFGDGLLASAAMLRLLHHAAVIELAGASYRRRKTAGVATAAAAP